jgi:hypothetical protein
VEGSLGQFTFFKKAIISQKLKKQYRKKAEFYFDSKFVRNWLAKMLL